MNIEIYGHVVSSSNTMKDGVGEIGDLDLLVKVSNWCFLVNILKLVSSSVIITTMSTEFFTTMSTDAYTETST